MGVYLISNFNLHVFWGFSWILIFKSDKRLTKKVCLGTTAVFDNIVFSIYLFIYKCLHFI